MSLNPGPQPWSHVNDTDKQEAIRLLAVGLSVPRVAERIGRRTEVIYDWAQNDPVFARALNALAAEKDDAAKEYATRVRRMASIMLDEIERMATDANLPALIKKDVVKTFFADVHNPAVLPKVPAAGNGPVVLVNADQAALLFAPAAATKE